MVEINFSPFRKFFASVFGFFRKCWSFVMNWWEGLHLSTNQQEGGVNDDARPEAEASSSVREDASVSAVSATKDKGQYFLNILLAVPDIAASLFLCAAVIVALRPQLLSSDFQKLPESFSAVIDFGSYFFKAYIRPKLPEEVLRYRNFFVVLFLFLYLFGKMWVIAFSVGKTRKALSVLFIAMTLLSCTLVADKFLVFILFVLLLFMGFQYSVGVGRTFAMRKLGIIVVLALSGYLAFVFCAYSETLHAWSNLLQAVKRCLSCFALPIQSWL